MFSFPTDSETLICNIRMSISQVTRIPHTQSGDGCGCLQKSSDQGETNLKNSG